eukprot:c11803_g1_i1.p1 GENE.c11803_g1_i1~~c11803_g1_i1.p1  ORF type:complete len:171 (+),score=32.97 c11803_g1_i1:461-973(+)
MFAIVLISRPISDLEIYSLSSYSKTFERSTISYRLLLLTEFGLGLIALMFAHNYSDITELDIIAAISLRLPLDYFTERRIFLEHPVDSHNSTHTVNITREFIMFGLAMASLASFISSSVALYYSKTVDSADSHSPFLLIVCGTLPVCLSRWVYQAHGGPRLSTNIFDEVL